MILDKNNNEVKVGSWVKVLFIEPSFIAAAFTPDEAKIVISMINRIFKVTGIEHEKALVEQAFNLTHGIALALAPEEMELATKDLGNIDIDRIATMH